MRTFNINGICYPDEYYMVNLDNRLKEIKKLVDKGNYFVMNRARQYGKTTTLKALEQCLANEYTVIFLGFQRLSAADFRDEYAFTAAFADAFVRAVRNRKQSEAELDRTILGKLEQVAGKTSESINLRELFNWLSDLCQTAAKPLVLMVDEVDSAANNQVFLDFLGQLRDRYLDRRETPTFHSVILAGVYDIKNLKLKIRDEGEHRYNSPWNIAADFRIDMSFSVRDIVGMLEEYEKDHDTGMDITEVAQLIFDYTSGYPFLVSYLCKLLDEQIAGRIGFESAKQVWCSAGIVEAVKEMMRTTNTLFDDMKKKLVDYPELRNMLYAILFNGAAFPYNPDSCVIDIGVMFGFLKEQDGQVCVTNRLFETRMYNYFLSEEMIEQASSPKLLYDKNQFIQNGFLNMDLVMKKFLEYFTAIYRDSDEKFVEENGRKLFLLYLKPIINGTGNYYIEARTRDMRRTDVVVDYRGRQYVIEMKIYHGDEYNRRGEKQLADYLDSYQLEKGYLLCFNFNKSKITGMKEVHCFGKTILEVVV